MLDKNVFQIVKDFTFFSSACFLHMSKQSFGKVLLAQVFLDFGCAIFLSGDKPQIFGFVIMNSGPRRWLTFLCSGFFTPDERWGTEKSWVKLEQAGLK